MNVSESNFGELEKRVSDLTTDVHEIKDIMLQIEGVIKFFKAVLWIGTPVALLIYWVKDHVKL